MRERVEPQSNQRGIETEKGKRGLAAAEPPQSNQRGIETGTIASRTQGGTMPQSNQRGIETGLIEGYRLCWIGASIEPAWD